MGDIHLLGSNLHVTWLWSTCMVKSKTILLSIHIFCTQKNPLVNFFRPPPPLSAIVSIWLTHPPPSSAMVRFWLTPLCSPGWGNMWTAPYFYTNFFVSLSPTITFFYYKYFFSRRQKLIGTVNYCYSGRHCTVGHFGHPSPPQTSQLSVCKNYCWVL